MRRKWKLRLPDGTEKRHPSEASTYRAVAVLRAAGPVRVYVDEGDGFGWQLYERIDSNER